MWGAWGGAGDCRMGGRFSAVALFAVLLAAGAAQAQVLEVHVDGSVVMYDGANQSYSRGAQPIARLLNPAHPGVKSNRHSHNRPMIAPPPETAEAIRVSAERHQVDAKLVEAVAYQESGFNRHAVSPKGARGTMQLMPETARRLGVDSSDFAGNIDGGANYLSQMMRRFDGNQAKALAAYNAGPASVERYGGVPPYAETQAYVHAILGRMGRRRRTRGRGQRRNPHRPHVGVLDGRPRRSTPPGRQHAPQHAVLEHPSMIEGRHRVEADQAGEGPAADLVQAVRGLEERLGSGDQNRDLEAEHREGVGVKEAVDQAGRRLDEEEQIEGAYALACAAARAEFEGWRDRPADGA